MTRISVCLLSLLLWLPCALAAQNRPDEARDILRRTAESFRRAGGVQASFSVRSPEGISTGVICLKGEKFVLEADGMTTWFDGRTQWTYLAASDEVNIAEPTPEELQGINPYAWLSLYEQGYALRLLPAQGGGTDKQVELTATEAGAQIERLVVDIDPAAWRPVRIALTLAGNTEPTVITVRGYRTGLSWPDRFFVFDRAAHPTAEVIDLR